jgi:hypothetical protein
MNVQRVGYATVTAAGQVIPAERKITIVEARL